MHDFFNSDKIDTTALTMTSVMFSLMPVVVLEFFCVMVE